MSRSRQALAPSGWYSGGSSGAATTGDALSAALAAVRRPVVVFENNGQTHLSHDGVVTFGGDRPAGGLPVLARAEPLHPRQLGDRSFCDDYGLDLPYVAGAMANGIASVQLVEAMGRARMLGFFGAAGLMPDVIEDAIDRISTRLGDRPWGFNLIHHPLEPELEGAIADLYDRRGVRLISASAYLGLTLPLVRYRVAGIRTDAAGRVITPNRIIAKVSRIEVARRFLSPPPADMLAELIRAGDITETQARLASTLPVAQDLTVEADSGGHTDNAPAVALIPTMLALRDNVMAERRYDVPLRIGAAGGISTPHSAAAAFAMGAAYVLTGSVNQACREAGTSDAVREMLAGAEQADVIMAPAADMFEMGVELQVLKRGTMFAMRARRLYDLYSAYDGLESIPAPERASIEKMIFRAPLDEVWETTRAFWQTRDPRQVQRAEREPKHRMALVFRWYLGKSSRWANAGDPERSVDYQVWCGPAMGAFNEWVRGSFLERWENRRVVVVALNILHGAAVLTRANALRRGGVELPPGCPDLSPKPPVELEEYLL